PFGTIDTPAQGGTASGTFQNFGWVLTPSGASMSGSGITLFIDGIAQPQACAYGANRTDIQSLFQGGGYANIDGAGGSFVIDTTTLTNGVHTIFWIATDDQNHADGIGSRYFTVLN